MGIKREFEAKIGEIDIKKSYPDDIPGMIILGTEHELWRGDTYIGSERSLSDAIDRAKKEEGIE